MERLCFMVKGMKTGGRPKINDIAFDKVIESLRNGSSIVTACKGARVSRAKFYEWKHRTPANTKLVNDVLDQRVQVVEDALYKNAMAGNTTAQIFFLKNRSPERWSDTQDVNHKGSISFTDFIQSEDDTKKK